MRHTLFLLLIVAMTSCKNETKQLEKTQKNSETKQKMPPQKTTYYFIRHAEKDLSDPSEPNPQLTEAGLERAALWADFFSDKDLDAIYSTNTTRTIQTVIPTLDKTKLELNFYEAYRAYSDEFMQATYGKTVLMVGHQDSLIKLINKILGKKKYEKIPADVYGNLYKLIIEKDGSKSSLVKMINN